MTGKGLSKYNITFTIKTLDLSFLSFNPDNICYPLSGYPIESRGATQIQKEILFFARNEN